ncbi:T6SS phospholipase effector Tle1-like catalytic domain-containing protein [Paraburkholderia sp. 22099]|uniref:T6SS phospholipase effector Tle1-like catalytic domain-containing protein n=1 Tax=Paraburkholderia TaxID=1822464 RepID=UPI00285E70A2|nr:DUF2235 domain-containing protein [Paraburkholderia terricola]MDR6491406.1 hypothetical protein [Paraburkholderia terricola]
MSADASALVRSIAASNRDVPRTTPGARQDCSDVLHLTFFFDGTGNNRDEDGALQKWSNVARLFDAARDDNSNGIYAVYTSGVGTPFNGAVPLTDKIDVWREDHLFGAMAGDGGERRLSKRDTDFSAALAQALVVNARKQGGELARIANENQNESFEKLNRALAGHRLIKVINISIFGFSRGAALARAFANRLLERCSASRDGSMSMDGYPVRFVFMGLFDTVASFGLPAQNMTLPFEDRELKIPSCVERCVHFVAAHELRFSFPVDLIRDNGRYRPGMIEKVYPGVHSDVGGGYAANEQGVSDSYARIPLNDMLAESLSSGVRLMSLDELKASRATIAHRFAVDDKTRQSYQQYTMNIGGQSLTVEESIKRHMQMFYSSCGTLSRNKQPIVGGQSLQDSFIKRQMWAGIDEEAPAYAEALEGNKSVVLSGQRIFFYTFKPEAWKLRAWETNAATSTIEFFAHYVHNSKVDFVLNSEPFSYFRSRGVNEQHSKQLAHGASGGW